MGSAAPAKPSYQHFPIHVFLAISFFGTLFCCQLMNISLAQFWTENLLAPKLTLHLDFKNCIYKIVWPGFRPDSQLNYLGNELLVIFYPPVYFFDYILL